MSIPNRTSENGTSEVLQTLDNIYLPEWRVICATFIIEDIRSFAMQVGDLSGTGLTTALKPLASWSRELAQACQDFDIMQITGLLPAFPDLVKDLAAADRDLPRSYDID